MYEDTVLRLRGGVLRASNPGIVEAMHEQRGRDHKLGICLPKPTGISCFSH